MYGVTISPTNFLAPSGSWSEINLWESGAPSKGGRTDRGWGVVVD